MNGFFTKAEKASDAYRMLTGASNLRKFLVTAASILGDLCDEVMPPNEEGGGASANYEGFCEWVEGYPVTPTLEGFWDYYWAVAAGVFHDYARHSDLTDWELYEEMVCPADPDWDPSIENKEECIRRQITQTCFAISRFVRGKRGEKYPNCF